MPLFHQDRLGTDIGKTLQMQHCGVSSGESGHGAGRSVRKKGAFFEPMYIRDDLPRQAWDNAPRGGA